MTKEMLIENIITLEWNQFDRVHNEGGRADCQNDPGTFYIMRKSQFLAWDRDTLESWLTDLKQAEAQQKNLIMEKYARMMENTAPEQYETIRPHLTIHSSARIRQQEELVALHVRWMEEFSRLFPKMAGNGRSIRSSTDTPHNTSYETYFRGELSTYSARTLDCYTRYVRVVQEQGVNLPARIMDNTAILYGYRNARDAESKL